MHCSSSEDETVSIIKDCNAAALNAADPAEATVKLHLQTATEAKERVQKLVDRFKDICNAINRDMGEPEGADVHGACNKIADRIIAANAKAPPVDGGPPTQWVTISLETTACTLDGNSIGTCLAQCAAQKDCDPVATCPAGSAQGKCAGQCGTCLTSGDNVACVGECRGECSFPAGGLDGGPACQGECRGKCAAATWQGSCSTGCGANFRGQCKGTCTGACDGVAYPTTLADGGGGGDAGDDGGDAGDGGVADGGADAGDGGPIVIPGSGVCTGVCTGACAGEASGTCSAKCLGDFTGGFCPGPNACEGVCNGVGVACATTCKGACATRGECAATCAAKCEGTLSEAKCSTAPTCTDANSICRSVCTFRAALATTCPGGSVDIRVAGDYQLPYALRNHAADFAAAAREATLIANNLGGVLQRPLGEFRSIGVVRDNARACAQASGPAYEDVRKLVNEAIGASLVIKGTKF